jgi:hypothetical protein
MRGAQQIAHASENEAMCGVLGQEANGGLRS